jgi:hypothetical protein
MKITEITESAKELRKSLRSLNTGPSIPSGYPDAEKSGYGDVRDLAAGNKLGSYSRPKPKTIAATPQTQKNTSTDKFGDIENPFARGKPVVFNEKVKSFVKLMRQQAENLGYEPQIVQDNYGLGVILYTKSNNLRIAFALNAGQQLPATFRIKVPSGSTPEETKEKIKDFTDGLTERNVDWKVPPSNKDHVAVNLTNAGDDGEARLKKFWEVVQDVEDMGEDFKITKVASKSLKSIGKQKTASFRYYLGAASLIYIAVKFNLPKIMPRGGGEKSNATFDINDNLIAKGYSEEAAGLMTKGRGGWDKENKEGIWREHAVPSDLIISKAVEMIKNNKSSELIDNKIIYEVAKMIQRNLILVWITIPERELIDYTLKLQTTMPQGDAWDPFKDDPLSRFEVAGIKIYDSESGARVKE